MHADKLLSDEGNIVLLDLTSGVQVCTEIKSVNTDHNLITTGKLMVFQIAVEPTDPTMPPGPNNPMQQKVNALPYGGPFMHPKSENELYASDIIMSHEPIEPIEKAYLQAVSGIEVVGASALGGLQT